MLPLEFVLSGPPVSQQTNRPENLRLWKAFVREEAEKHWFSDNLPTAKPVVLEVTYFFITDNMDVDNMAKPIQDALQGLVYFNDRQVTDLLARKRDLTSVFRFEGIPSILTASLSREDPFLYIEVEEALSQEVLDE